MRDKSIPNSSESAIASQDSVLIPLHAPNGSSLFAKVDRCDADLISQHRWQPMSSRHSTYARRGYRKDGKIVTAYMHTAILGDPPEGMVIDHINGDGLDNRRANLRFATRSENRRNSPRISPSSAFIGIAQIKTGRWMARIVVDGERLYLGVYDSEAKAARAYDRAAKEHLGDFAQLNFPETSGSQS